MQDQPNTGGKDVADVIRYITPTVVYDGTFFSNKGVTELHFTQTRVKEGNTIKQMDSVASVRFDSIEHIRDLAKALEKKVWELEHPE